MAEEVGANGAVWSGWKAARDALRQWREESYRKSDRVVDLGRRLLEGYASKLGDEAWDVHEQVCVAALDCGEHDTAKLSLQALQGRFSGSVRVKRLHGMCLEAEGEYDEALKFYSSALEESATNIPLLKRKVAVHRAKGDTAQAIKELTEFLEVFMNDSESWMELSDLYIQQNDYEKAAFCLEELVLANPHHHLYHQRYAEICYTQGTVDGLELARKHFATALKLNPDSMRALYGFCLASHTLCVHPKVKSRGEVKARNSRYIDWAKAQLKHKYQLDNEKLRLVERMLDSLGSSR